MSSAAFAECVLFSTYIHQIVIPLSSDLIIQLHIITPDKCNEDYIYG